MTKTDMLGTFEQMVLTAVLALRDEAYGLAIHEKVTEFAGRPMNVGSVYVTLDRLRKKGYVTSRLIEPPPERGGQFRRYYRLRADGARVLKDSIQTTLRFIDAFEGAKRARARHAR
ncbi:MAG TPA: helix-turn-helix transcriptional regulator [Terriglobia bacterium]|nr:helix-turn-helix transcriptional regulator [Terriglobia bacterium]